MIPASWPVFLFPFLLNVIVWTTLSLLSQQECLEQALPCAGAAPRSLPVEPHLALASPRPPQLPREGTCVPMGSELVYPWNYLREKTARSLGGGGGLWVLGNETSLPLFLDQCFLTGSDFAP